MNKKTRKIIYWIATIWLALGMTSTGIVQLLQLPEEAEVIVNLGYPMYLLSLLGIWKLLGVVAVLIPKTPLIKEWAYAGFFFAMSGAIFSHIAAGALLNEALPALLLLVLTILSWYFRPERRRITDYGITNL